jgi:hypothetical protein
MLLPDGDEVEAIAPSHVPLMDFFKELLPKCCHAHSTAHGTGPSRKLSDIRYLRLTMVLPILIGTSGNVAAGTHMPQHKRSALKESFGLRLLQQCERFVRVALYCQINWISLAVVGGCTALFMVGAILAYDPSRGFLARRGEPGGGT